MVVVVEADFSVKLEPQAEQFATKYNCALISIFGFKIVKSDV